MVSVTVEAAPPSFQPSFPFAIHHNDSRLGTLHYQSQLFTVITDELAKALEPTCPAGIRPTFITAPPEAPPSINDATTSILSAAHTFQHLLKLSPGSNLASDSASGYLVACFSDHPLVGMLRHCAPEKPSLHLLEASVIHALSCGSKFGVLTTGRDMVADIDAGVRKVLGGNSDKYVGTVATGLGVVELQTGDSFKVENVIKAGAAKVAQLGADVIILGCAGMVGMESIVRKGAIDAGFGSRIAVIDGAKAGVQILAGLVRTRYWD